MIFSPRNWNREKVRIKGWSLMMLLTRGRWIRNWSLVTILIPKRGYLTTRTILIWAWSSVTILVLGGGGKNKKIAWKRLILCNNTVHAPLGVRRNFTETNEKVRKWCFVMTETWPFKIRQFFQKSFILLEGDFWCAQRPKSKRLRLIADTVDKTMINMMLFPVQSN